MAAALPTDLGSLLSAVVRRREWQRRLRLHQVFLFWEEVVGREIAKHAQPEVIKNDVLWLAVSDSMWMQHLQFERHHLLSSLNARLTAGEGAGQRHEEGRRRETEAEAPLLLTDLRLQLDPTLKGRPAPPAPHRPPSAPVVDQAAFASFTGSLQTIDDPELRTAMTRLWLAMQGP